VIGLQRQVHGMTMRPVSLAFLLSAAMLGLLAGDAATVSVERQSPGPATSNRPAWTEVKWPFALDQWGVGRAFICRAADCGGEVDLYLRAKLGFCNCTTGVSDDAELDRVGDLELLNPSFNGLSEGRPITVGWMSGRSRRYQVSMRYAAPRAALAVAFNDKCDVMVTTVVAERNLAAAERAALEFLNGDLVLRWVEKELGF
jgi:hypothetical protein